MSLTKEATKRFKFARVDALTNAQYFVWDRLETRQCYQFYGPHEDPAEAWMDVSDGEYLVRVTYVVDKVQVVQRRR